MRFPFAAACAMFSLLSCLSARAQSGEAESLPVDSAQVPLLQIGDSLQLPDRFIDSSSFSVSIVGYNLPASALRLDAARGVVHIDSAARAAIHRDSAVAAAAYLRVSYRFAPFLFPESFAHRIPKIILDSSGKAVRIAQRTRPANAETYFGSGLQKSGMLSRGISLTTNRDVTLTSGFRLQLSGQIARDVEVIGSLTDENTPIQPEGNTQTIREIDRIFLQIKAPQAQATLGDLYLDWRGSELAPIARKVQGGEGTVRGFGGSASIAAATTRGKYATMPFAGIDGVQGPYQLTSETGARDIVVIAGTEHVYVDGVSQSRGENLDYVIDYGLAQIAFKPRRLITSTSRISVEFEYSDRKYSRTLLAARGDAASADSAISVLVSYVREADNQEATIDFSLGDSDRAILAAAGGDPTKAVRSGVQFAGYDTIRHTGAGLYARRDTLIGSHRDSVFVYVPGDTSATYVVTFTYVGEGRGEYAHDAGFQYTWKGPAGGAYLPLVYLPLPQKKELGDVSASFRLGPGIHLRTEAAYSAISLNRFSSLPSATGSGAGGSVALSVDPAEVSAFGAKLGRIGLESRVRFLDPRFSPLERIDPVEFGRDWNVAADRVAAQQKEDLYSASIRYEPWRSSRIEASIGRITRGDSSRSDRATFTLGLAEPSMPRADYHVDLVSTGTGRVTSSSIRDGGNGDWNLGVFAPGVAIQHESRRDDGLIGLFDAVRSSTGYRFFEAVPRLAMNAGSGLTISGSYGLRSEDSVHASVFEPASRATTLGAGVEYTGRGGVTGAIDFTDHLHRYLGTPSELVPAEVRSVLLRARSRFATSSRAIEGDVNYQASSERSAQLERRFVVVPYGTGQYTYKGDLNGNHVQDEDEFAFTTFGDGTYALVLVPSDKLVPVTGVQTSARIRLDGSKAAAALPFPSWLTSESYIRIDEKSTDAVASDVYLMRFSHFQNDSLTIAGTSWLQQDFSAWELNREFSLRARLSERRGLTRLAGGAERNYSNEHSLLVRWHLVEEINSESTIGTYADNAASPASSINPPRVLYTLRFRNDLSYRLDADLEFGFIVDLKSTDDRRFDPAVTASKDDITLRATRAFGTFGRLRAEVQRYEIAMANQPAGYIAPYQLTDGYLVGQNWSARATFEYRIGANIQASSTYSARLHRGAAPLHAFQAEVRAFI